MKQYKVVTIHSGVWTINCDYCDYCGNEHQNGWVRFECEGRNVAIFNLAEIVGVIEEDNG